MGSCTVPSYRTVFRSALVLSLILSLALLAGCAMPGFLKPQKPEKPAQPRGTTVALVVPSGKVASIVTALTSGARLAAQQQAGTRPVTVRVIATQGNWLQELAALPENTVIGGPLSEASYKKMKAAGIMDKKVVFAFLGKLDAGDEGTVAWRFYPSLEDQIDAVVKLSVDRLDIRTMASFGPADNFSVAATNLLEQKLAAQNIILQRISAGSNPATWGEQLKPYINTQTDEATGALIPQTPFEAVFLPDSWRRLGSVHTAFASNGEDRLVMLGTMLWDGFNTRGTQNASQYTLVAYPSAFVRSTAPASLAKTNFATFWGALGYDFVRFASRLNVQGRPASPRVSAAARQAALMDFAMAPISYDAGGKASQRLVMVQPGLAGPVPVDLNTMRAARAAAQQRVEDRRLQATEAEAAQAAQPVQPVQGTMAPVQAPGLPGPDTGKPIMRTTPHSSYKLSLPGTR